MAMTLVQALAVATTAALLSGPTLAFAPPRTSQCRQAHGRTTRSSSGRLYLGDFFNFGKPKAAEPDTSAETARDEAPEEEEYYDDDDPIEKIFGVFFGKKEKAPGGMARFGQERFPEQYPAVLDAWAEPVATDDAEMATLRPLLKNTNLETRPLRLLYDGNRDGWEPGAFHAKVDKQSGCVVLCTTRAGIKCGGYNPKGWVGYGEARGSIAAFLFILGGKYANAATGAPGIKLRKIGGPGLAQMDLPESGPSFSPDALVIPMQANNNPRAARSKLGSYYERLPDGTNSLFGKDASVQLRDLRVYNGVYAEGEYVPFTDAEPFALY